MDANSAQMIDFVFFPIQTIVACNYILFAVHSAIVQSINRADTAEIGQCLEAGRNMLHIVKVWPIMLEEHSIEHWRIKKIIDLSSSWLDRSPLFDGNKLDMLKRYLEKLPGFSASGLTVDALGRIKNRDSIILQQSMFPQDLRNPKDSFHCVTDLYMRRYHNFMTELLWAREEPMSRMLAPGFEGSWKDHPARTCDNNISQQLEDFNITDDASTVAMDTPSTTRANSPAPIERQGNPASNRTIKSKPTEPPTLKYIAVIETATEKAIFNLDTNKVDEKQHKILVNAKDMYTEMASMSYGGKTKLQDVMDLTVQMATKWEEVRGKQAIQEKKVYGGFGYY